MSQKFTLTPCTSSKIKLGKVCRQRSRQQGTTNKPLLPDCGKKALENLCPKPNAQKIVSREIFWTLFF